METNFTSGPVPSTSEFEKRREGGTVVYAFNIKQHIRGDTVDFAELRKELGLEGRKAPIGTDPPAEFSAKWCERYAEENPQAYAESLESWARESAFEHAAEYATELFGVVVKAWSSGRSGGWLYLEGIYSAEVVEEAEDALHHLDKLRAELAIAKERGLTEAEESLAEEVAREEDSLPMSQAEFDTFLRKLKEFQRYVIASVADFPRQVAWQVGANVFQHAAEEFEADETEFKEAEERASAQAELLRIASELVGAVESGAVGLRDLYAGLAVAVDRVRGETLPRRGRVSRDCSDCGKSFEADRFGTTRNCGDCQVRRGDRLELARGVLEWADPDSVPGDSNLMKRQAEALREVLEERGCE